MIDSTKPTRTNLPTNLLWWDSLTQDQQIFITQKITPGWTIQMFRSSTSSLNRAISFCVWDNMLGWPK